MPKRKYVKKIIFLIAKKSVKIFDFTLAKKPENSPILLKFVNK